MSELIQVQFGRRAPGDLPQVLRELADAAERGELTGLVCAYVRDGEYYLNHATSLQEGLVLATLLHQSAVSKFRE